MKVNRHLCLEMAESNDECKSATPLTLTPFRASYYRADEYFSELISPRDVPEVLGNERGGEAREYSCKLLKYRCQN